MWRGGESYKKHGERSGEKIRRRERLILQAASQRLSARSLLLLPPLSNPLATLNQELNGLLQCSFVSHQKGA